MLGDASTAVDVSGERLDSEATRTWVVLGLGAAYRRDGRFLNGGVSAYGLGSDDRGYTASLNLGIRF